MKKKTWYLLYDGSSPDGRGDAQFMGRTTDKKVAVKHFKKCNNDPYCTGYVLAVTDSNKTLIIWEKDFKALEE